MSKLKERLAIAKEIVQTISTASSIMVATTMILEIFQYINAINKSFLPLPIVAVICYIVGRFLPTGISQIKKLVEQTIQRDTFTEAELKELNEIKAIIDGKVNHVLETSRNEPVSENTIVEIPVFIDEDGNEYVRRQ